MRHEAMQYRGSVLLEVVVAIAVFVGVALAVMACVDRATGGLERARGVQRAADLARTAMSQLEAGLATTATLNGPVAVVEGLDGPGVPYAGGDSGDGESGWELEVQTEPSEFASLTKVTIIAMKRPPGASAAEYQFTLTQLVRLGERAGDVASAGGGRGVEGGGR